MDLPRNEGALDMRIPAITLPILSLPLVSHKDPRPQNQGRWVLDAVGIEHTSKDGSL